MEGFERLSTAPADKRRLPGRAISPKGGRRGQAAAFEAKPIDESTAPSRKSTDRIVARTVAGGREAPSAARNPKRPHCTLPCAGIRDFDTARRDRIQPSVGTDAHPRQDLVITAVSDECVAAGPTECW